MEIFSRLKMVPCSISNQRILRQKPKKSHQRNPLPRKNLKIWWKNISQGKLQPFQRWWLIKLLKWVFWDSFRI